MRSGSACAAVPGVRSDARGDRRGQRGTRGHLWWLTVAPVQDPPDEGGDERRARLRAGDGLSQGERTGARVSQEKHFDEHETERTRKKWHNRAPGRARR